MRESGWVISRANGTMCPYGPYHDAATAWADVMPYLQEYGYATQQIAEADGWKARHGTYVWTWSLP